MASTSSLTGEEAKDAPIPIPESHSAPPTVTPATAAASKTSSAISSLKSWSSMVSTTFRYATSTPMAAKDSIINAASYLSSTTTESTLFFVHFWLTLLDLIRGAHVESLLMAVLKVIEHSIELLQMDECRTLITSLLTVGASAPMAGIVAGVKKAVVALFEVLRTDEIREFRNKIWRLLRFVRKYSGKSAPTTPPRDLKPKDKGTKHTTTAGASADASTDVSTHSDATVTSSVSSPTVTVTTTPGQKGEVGGGRRPSTDRRRVSWIGGLLGTLYAEDSDDQNADDESKEGSLSPLPPSADSKKKKFLDPRHAKSQVPQKKSATEKSSTVQRAADSESATTELRTEGSSRKSIEAEEDGKGGDKEASASPSFSDWTLLLQYIDNLEDKGMLGMSEGAELRKMASMQNEQLMILYTTYHENDGRFLRHARSMLDWKQVDEETATDADFDPIFAEMDWDD